MVGVHKDPKGEEIFKNSNLNASLSKETDLTDVSELRKRIKELEAEVKQKDVR